MNPKQELFILEYQKDFNATQAAIRAGYSQKTAYSQGQRLLKAPEVKEALESDLTTRKSDLIATREQRQQLWTQIMYDTEQSTRDRLRASELLAKSCGDFIERIEATETSLNLDMRAQVRMALLEHLHSQENTQLSSTAEAPS